MSNEPIWTPDCIVWNAPSVSKSSIDQCSPGASKSPRGFRDNIDYPITPEIIEECNDPTICLILYHDLVTYYQTNPISNTVYYETHHILPRSMNGGDEAENLVKLLPENHMDAHLLLAKGYGTKKAWAAYWLMVEVAERKHGDKHISTRADYAEIMKHRPSGKSHYKYDATVYHFVHSDGRVFSGSGLDFSEYAGLNRRAATALITDTLMSHSGWRLVETDEEYIGRKGKTNGKYDHTTHRFVNHKDGNTFEGTQQEFCKHISGSQSHVSSVVRGSRLSTNGWCLEGTDPSLLGQKGKNHPAYDRTIHSFFHDQKETFEGTQLEFREFTELPQGAVSALVCGKIKSTSGWYLTRSISNRETTYGLNKTQFLLLIKAGEPRPTQKSYLGQILVNYLNKNCSAFRPGLKEELIAAGGGYWFKR